MAPRGCGHVKGFTRATVLTVACSCAYLATRAVTILAAFSAAWPFDAASPAWSRPFFARHTPSGFVAHLVGRAVVICARWRACVRVIIQADASATAPSQPLWTLARPVIAAGHAVRAVFVGTALVAVAFVNHRIGAKVIATMVRRAAHHASIRLRIARRGTDEIVAVCIDKVPVTIFVIITTYGFR